MDAAGVGADLAVQHVEAGGFAGAVGADEGKHFTARHGEGYVGDGLDAAEGFAQAGDGEDRHASRPLSHRR